MIAECLVPIRHAPVLHHSGFETFHSFLKPLADILVCHRSVFLFVAHSIAFIKNVDLPRIFSLNRYSRVKITNQYLKFCDIERENFMICVISNITE